MTLAWSETPSEPITGKLMLPLTNNKVSNEDALQRLVDACSPATFGRGDEDVLDPSYRQAGKLDDDKFLSNFYPANFGILQNIEQILMPSVSTDMENQLQFRRITAELYKLNVGLGLSSSSTSKYLLMDNRFTPARLVTSAHTSTPPGLRV